MAKFSKDVSASRRKSRKAHFSSDSETRRTLMSAPLSKALRLEHKVRSLPVRQGDTVQVRSGEKKGEEGVIKSVYRKKFVIYVDRLTRDSCRGTQVQVGVHPSKVEITKIKMDSDRKAVLKKSGEAKARIVKKYTGAVDTDSLPVHKVRDLVKA